MAAAAVSLACPLRRSTRLAHHHPRKQTFDQDDSSSSDPENELTPRALRALKRQRLALDPDGLPLSNRSRAKKRRKPVSSQRRSPPKPLENSTPKPELSIPLPPISPDSSDEEPLTPLTPLTPSPESSPSLPGHDRHPLPPQDPPPVSLEPIPIPEPPPHSTADSFSPPPLDPPFNTLIPFEGLHPQFDPELSVQIPPPPSPPQLQPLDLQGQFHSFPQHQIYVPPNPVFVRDREINIWKLACQERVDCLLRRYGTDYIKALVESQARSLSRENRPSSPSQTMFRLYTPASYTYSLSSWSSTSGPRKAFPIHDHPDDADPGWPIDDADWVDADVDMEDDDEDDDDDDDDSAEPDTERQGEATVEGLVISDAAPPKPPAQPIDVDARPTTKSTATPDTPPPPTEPDLSTHPIPYPFPSPPPLTPPTLPPLSSFRVPLLSEPPRAFMGRGTPPDRQRLVEWSGSGRLATNGMGPPLYLSPVPQRHPNPDVGIVPMSIDTPIHPPPHPVQPPHTHGEWTSFLYSMLEGDGVGVGTSIPGTGHVSEPAWYELGLASVPPVVPQPALQIPPERSTTPSVEHPPDDGSNSSSTLRFALG